SLSAVAADSVACIATESAATALSEAATEPIDDRAPWFANLESFGRGPVTEAERVEVRLSEDLFSNRVEVSPPETAAVDHPIEPPAPAVPTASEAAATQTARADELARSAAELAELLGGTAIASPPSSSSEAPFYLQPAPALREPMIPPSPEPDDLTALTTPPIESIGPPPLPIERSTPPPVAELPVITAARLPAGLRRPSLRETSAPPEDPRAITLGEEARRDPALDASAPVPLELESIGSGMSPRAAAAAPELAESGPEPKWVEFGDRGGATKRESEAVAIPEWARMPEPPTAGGARRQPALHPDWPERPRLDTVPTGRRFWIGVGSVVAALVGVGWLLGLMLTGDATETGKPNPITSLLAAIGLRAPSFALEVESRPEGAAILIDGVSTGKRAPASLTLKPGTHRVTLSFGQWGEQSWDMEGRRGQKLALDGVMYGALEIFAPAPGSVVAVSVDGQARGFAPLRVDSLSPGPHQLRYSGPGMTSWGHSVDVRVLEEKQVLPRPIQSPSTGLIMVRASTTQDGEPRAINGAQVWVDGELKGVTPLALELMRGPHSVRVRYQATEPPIQVIDLPGGNQRFAMFEFGTGGESPRLEVQAPNRFPANGTGAVTVSIDGLPPREVREMWLHVRGSDGTWRRYEMSRVENPLAAGAVAPFPVSEFEDGGETLWYVSAITRQGDEYFTEIASARVVASGR
ncbi:MAG: PEGA domain-containing protein, partial [Candidatus Eisenbacteria bacterium]|nr:PEGA domain-containing protein [Candidatus Eisenbacteria bacterium]